MSGVQDRVKGFLETWQIIGNQGCHSEAIAEESLNCHCCGAKPSDGNFAVIDGKLYCLKCKPKP
jgi:hypothetical protein